MPENASDTGVIKGSVESIDTGRPIHGIDVWLSNSELRTQTGPEGSFGFSRIFPGSYHVTVVLDDYKMYHQEVTVFPGSESTADFAIDSGSRGNFGRLATVDDSLDYYMSLVDELETKLQVQEREFELFRRQLSGTRDEDFNLFKKSLLGDSDNILLTNPAAVSIKRKGDALTAASDKPLRIINQDLGYELVLLLNSYKMRETRLGYRFEYDAITYFTELREQSEEESEIWRENRLKAYSGSIRHFFTSLAAGSSQQEGFDIFRGATTVGTHVLGSTINQVEDIRIRPEKIISRNDSDTWILRSDRELRVTYRPEIAERELDYAGIRKYEPQTSWLLITDGPLVIGSSGTILSGDYKIAGYWKTRPVSELLPASFNPSGI